MNNKVAIITDLHFGIRNDNASVVNAGKRFFSEVFFPKIDADGIDTVIQLGDTFDRRKYINFYTLYQVKEFFFEELRKRNLRYIQISGNHDTYFTPTSEVNSLDLVLPEFGFETLHTATTINVKGRDICMVPWINSGNAEATGKELAGTKAMVCMGHFEIVGFEMDGGAVCADGMDTAALSKFACVFSGHFHKRQSKGSIHYLGTPWESTWSDYGLAKGFHIFDVQDFSLEFVENPNKLFVRYVYDDSAPLPVPKNVEGSYVRIAIRKKTNPYLFDKFVDSINILKPTHLSFTDEAQIIVANGAIANTNIQIEDTLTTIATAVQELKELSVSNDNLLKYMSGLYNRGQELTFD